MSQAAVQQLEADLLEAFANAPNGIGNHTLLTFPNKPKLFNAATHGLSGQFVVLAAEELPRYAQMALEYMLELQPVGARETSNAQCIFEAKWRLHRIAAVENSLFSGPRRAQVEKDKTLDETGNLTPGYAAQLAALREESHLIEVVGRYETRMIRNAQRLTEELEHFQAKREQRPTHAVFNEETSPAIIWYEAVIVRCKKLAQAKQEYEEAVLEAGSAAEAGSSVESNTSSENPFGKKTSRANSGQ